MQRDHHDPAEAEPHVFDQTNGLVDFGESAPPTSDAERDSERHRTVGGIAMLSANRPAG